jgi:predicted ferric reductase
MTYLGGQACILGALIVLKFAAQCFGVDSPNDGESSNTSYFRLHEAFQYPAQKMLSQAMYVVFIIGIFDILNINALHSSSLELMIEASFIAILIWILVGFYIIYYAQAKMKKWYNLEANAHDT